MAWIYLITAALFEIGWPLGFKMAHLSEHKIVWIVFSVAAMTLSGAFLYLAQKHITISVAYAVWTGIGAMGTFLLGVLVFGDGSASRYLPLTIWNQFTKSKTLSNTTSPGMSWLWAAVIPASKWPKT